MARSESPAGCFITFEGIEGAGKSTQITRLAAALRQRKHRVLTTFEPGATPLGVQIRDLVMSPSGMEPTSRTELLLYLADRAQHVERVIRPALVEGQVVLCDRFSGSTIAYQGHGRRLPLDLVIDLDTAARGGLAPSLTILLDCDVEQGLRRASGHDRLQRESLEFHRRVQAGFHALARESPSWVTIRSDRDPDAVAGQILKAVSAAGVLP